MADYYDVEVKSDGSMRVTPRENAGCGTVVGVIILMLILSIIFSFSDDSSDLSYTEANNHQKDNSVENGYRIDALADLTGEVDIFDAPVSKINQGGIEIVSYSSYEHTDLDGDLHRGCYMLLCEGEDYYVSYKLNGKFSKLTGRLYAQTAGAKCWLEFYNGSTLIYSTPYLSEIDVSCTVNIDVSDIDVLTIYLCSDDDFGWLIAKDFVLSE